MDIEKVILDGCKESDRRSQFKLYECCYPYLMSISLRYRQDENEAASAVNIAFLKILNNIHLFDPGLPFKGWIRQIMIRTLIDEYRKQKKLNEQYQSGNYEKDIALNGIHVDYNEAESNLNVEELLGYIHRLNPLTSTVFNLFVLDGYSHKDIGELINITESASKWHLFTARKQLQDLVSVSIDRKKPTLIPTLKISTYEK
ncbi:MAG: sigma-70 family RNA polymerase sigma factor [Saprospiraceae bacterium]|nr:sigma-70 family RNA polymerase sigma factor [Saprospiraceae bacterium]MBK8778547.1 sigma-70 family RNA polymerase sigma factor [Saprospiraceae bacterium]MBK9930722.1 sigma-70 family RNA polymerase sigma factor [Saprospiraceae bacterium]